MIERKCINCGKVFGQGLDDGSGGDDTGIGLCEICRGGLPGADSEVKPSTTTAGQRATLGSLGQGQYETSNCPRQPENVEPQGDKAFLSQLGASGQPEIQKGAAVCLTGRRSSILDGLSAPVARSGGLFLGL